MKSDDLMRILMITKYITYPPNSGFPLRVYELPYRIARKHEIWSTTFMPAAHDPNDITHLQKFC